MLVGEPLDQCPFVGIEVDAGDRVERGRGFLVHVVLQELREQTVLGHLVGVAVAGEVAEVAHALVAGVEQAQLHQFVGFDVFDELDAGVLEGRPPEAEVVLKDPLFERFAHHRPRVLDAEFLGDCLTVGVCGYGGDAVHHAVGKGDVLLHPGAQLRVLELCEGGEHGAGNVAVALDVVAGHYRERREPACPTPGQRFGDESEGGPGCGTGLVVVDDVGVGGVEVARDVVEVVAALGDCQRNNPDGVGGHLLDHCFGIVGREEVLDDRTDDPPFPGSVRVLHHQGVQAALAVHHLFHPGIAGQDPDAADGPVMRLAGVHQPVQVHGLVRAVETAHAEVDDPGGQAGAVVGGHCQGVRQSGKDAGFGCRHGLAFRCSEGAGQKTQFG
ncbi:hypothetical protein D9M72_412190 [compost metagenome]